MSAIARSAEVNAPVIYRRWPTRAALLEEAVHGPGNHEFPEPTNDLRMDLVTWIRIFLARAAGPAAHVGIPGLLADVSTEEDRERLVGIARRFGTCSPRAYSWLSIAVRISGGSTRGFCSRS
ncbi:TetR family transcriptional regulator [Rhodococcus sp. BP22]|uniref:TetR family transcriptional regulator n=1 Tax=Rhodococcus sp. BP22 TaxID=2758566 RepID=UPI0028F6D19C|nr:TetR family transcriptional regulator [Rhodococcus sp. BP22]